MVVEEFPSFWDWSFGGAGTFLGVVAAVVLLGIFFGYLVCAVRHGPGEGFYAMAKVLADSVSDFAQTSPRRTLAMTKLAIQESIRRRVLLAAFGLFAVALLIGGWFLDVRSDHPDRIYITFVMWGTYVLILVLVILLSAFSLPNDIRSRTIHTVVTKPVRAGEIVLGRVLGFVAIGTVLLATMALISYFFVVRGLSHRHTIAAADFTQIEPESDRIGSSDEEAPVSPGMGGFTTTNSHHRHRVVIANDGAVYADPAMGHTHEVTLRFDLAGDWSFAIRSPNGERQELNMQLSGSPGQFSGTVKSTAAGEIELEDVGLHQAQFSCTVSADLLDVGEVGQLIAVLAIPRGDELLSMKGEIYSAGRSAAGVEAHQVKRASDRAELVALELGPPQGMLQARVPHYGKLRFLDPTGRPRQRGDNVGDEWAYRSHILGGSLAAAIWEFENVRLEDFIPNDFTKEEREVALIAPAERTESQQDLAIERQLDQRVALPIEMTLAVFRTYKADIERGVMGQLVVKHPSRPEKSVAESFISQEYSTFRKQIPRELDGEDHEGRPFKADLFRDFVDEEGRVEIQIRCDDPGQYLGMAQADLYIRAEDGSFFGNLMKGYLGIWLQMVIIVSIGVMFSTFLSTPVAFMATVSVVSVGFFTKFITELTSEQWPAGGPFESIVRILLQKNMMNQLEPGLGTTLMKRADDSILWFLQRASYAIPDFKRFDTSNYVAYGFNISPDLVGIQLTVTLAFAVGLSIVAYFFLKTREIAA